MQTIQCTNFLFSKQNKKQSLLNYVKSICVKGTPNKPLSK